MSSKVLQISDIPSLQPAEMLWSYYDSEEAEFRFNANSKSAASEWQSIAREALNKTIGFQDLPKSDDEVQFIESIPKDGYRREKILLKTSINISMPVYLLIPDDCQKSTPTVIAFHGHGYGVKDIVGLWENGEERDVPDGYHKDFAIELCKRGFVVVAPEISCFGERQTAKSSMNHPSTCAHTSMLAFHYGGSALGLRVYDCKKLIDYLETRKEIDSDKIGVMGISGGGMHAFFSTCLDLRIKVSVISGYYSAFKDSIFAMEHCLCNFVPGLSKFGEIYDLVGLIAPRPLLIESGSHDKIFPRKSVVRCVEKTEKVYKVFSDEFLVETDYFVGRHRINGEKAYDFLMEKLK